MKVNLGYLYDILGYMTEAQYWDQNLPEDYQGFIVHYKEVVECQRNESNREEFRKKLKDVLKAILNNPSLKYDEIFVAGAMHGLGSDEKAKRIFELIWQSFFGSEDWHDSSFSSSDFNMVDEPFSA
jgi:hypothetical protein